MSVYTMVYRSQPCFSGVVKDDLDGIDQILATARRRNEQASVSGALLFNEDWIVQLLEGDRDAVKETFDRISLDPRHRNVEVLYESLEAGRRFEKWSMAFVGDAAAIRTRFADSPLAKRDVTMRGQEVVEFLVALACDGAT